MRPLSAPAGLVIVAAKEPRPTWLSARPLVPKISSRSRRICLLKLAVFGVGAPPRDSAKRPTERLALLVLLFHPLPLTLPTAPIAPVEEGLPVPPLCAAANEC